MGTMFLLDSALPIAVTDDPDLARRLILRLSRRSLAYPERIRLVWMAIQHGPARLTLMEDSGAMARFTLPERTMLAATIGVYSDAESILLEDATQRACASEGAEKHCAGRLIPVEYAPTIFSREALDFGQGLGSCKDPIGDLDQCATAVLAGLRSAKTRDEAQGVAAALFASRPSNRRILELRLESLWARGDSTWIRSAFDLELARGRRSFGTVGSWIARLPADSQKKSLAVESFRRAFVRRFPSLGPPPPALLERQEADEKARIHVLCGDAASRKCLDSVQGTLARWRKLELEGAFLRELAPSLGMPESYASVAADHRHLAEMLLDSGVPAGDPLARARLARVTGEPDRIARSWREYARVDPEDVDSNEWGGLLHALGMTQELAELACMSDTATRACRERMAEFHPEALLIRSLRPGNADLMALRLAARGLERKGRADAVHALLDSLREFPSSGLAVETLEELARLGSSRAGTVLSSGRGEERLRLPGGSTCRKSMDENGRLLEQACDDHRIQAWRSSEGRLVSSFLETSKGFERIDSLRSVGPGILLWRLSLDTGAFLAVLSPEDDYLPHVRRPDGRELSLDQEGRCLAALERLLSVDRVADSLWVERLHRGQDRTSADGAARRLRGRFTKALWWPKRSGFVLIEEDSGAVLLRKNASLGFQTTSLLRRAEDAALDPNGDLIVLGWDGGLERVEAVGNVHRNLLAIDPQARKTRWRGLVATRAGEIYAIAEGRPYRLAKKESRWTSLPLETDDTKVFPSDWIESLRELEDGSVMAVASTDRILSKEAMGGLLVKKASGRAFRRVVEADSLRVPNWLLWARAGLLEPNGALRTRGCPEMGVPLTGNVIALKDGLLLGMSKGLVRIDAEGLCSYAGTPGALGWPQLSWQDRAVSVVAADGAGGLLVGTATALEWQERPDLWPGSLRREEDQARVLGRRGEPGKEP